MSTSKTAKAAKEQAAKDALRAQIRFIAIGATDGSLWSDPMGDGSPIDDINLMLVTDLEGYERFILALRRTYEDQSEHDYPWGLQYLSKFASINSATEHLWNYMITRERAALASLEAELGKEGEG